MHEKYEVLLSNYELSEELLGLFTDVLIQIFKQYNAEAINQSTNLKRQSSTIDEEIKQVRVRYATGKIDEETYSVAINELQERKDIITLELGKWDIDLSNLQDTLPSIITTASNISILWHNSDLETKRRIQNLVFPEGIYWDSQISDYRTISKNKFFELLDTFSISYGNAKGTTSSEVVPLCI